MSSQYSIKPNLSFILVSSHIKVPTLEPNSQGNDNIKATKLSACSLQPRTRSLSAKSQFRAIFKTPKSKDTPPSLQFPIPPRFSTKSSQIRHTIPSTLQKRLPNQAESPHLTEICHQIAQVTHDLKSKIDQRQILIKPAETFKENLKKPCIPRINLSISPVPLKPGPKTEELITFRPNATPIQKPRRFPREIFSAARRRN